MCARSAKDKPQIVFLQDLDMHELQRLKEVNERYFCKNVTLYVPDAVSYIYIVYMSCA